MGHVLSWAEARPGDLVAHVVPDTHPEDPGPTSPRIESVLWNVSYPVAIIFLPRSLSTHCVSRPTEGDLSLSCAPCHTWEKDGKKQSKLYVKADNVQFMGGKSEKTETKSKTDEEIPF